MAARTLAFTLAAAEENGRQIVSQMLSPPPDGLIRLIELSYSLLHRLDYVELPAQTNFSKPIYGFLVWGTLTSSAKSLGFALATIEDIDRKALTEEDAHPVKNRSQGDEPPYGQDLGEDGAASWNHWLRRLHFSIRPTLHLACDGGGVKDNRYGNTTLDNENTHQLGRSRFGSELPLVRGSEKTQMLDLLKAYTRSEMRPTTSLPTADLGKQIPAGKMQIFIKMAAGRSIMMWVSSQDTVESVKAGVEAREGLPRTLFYFLLEGKVLQEDSRLLEYQISKNTTIILLHRMRGGAEGKRGPYNPPSYKDVARSKRPQTEATSSAPPSSPYIVEKLDTIPSLEVKNPQVNHLFSQLQTHAVICRFNGFWPRSFDLHEWVFTNWTVNCQILLCSKGFFVVQFELLEDYQKIFAQGPWFWGRAGLSITPWFPEFDANTMVVTKVPVWVRLPNLPLPFWHHLVLEDIGNLLGTYVKCDSERKEKGLFTYARICVEIDLSIGLPDIIKLIYETYKWMQVLDYENTAFRCRSCQMTGHLQDMCPLAKKLPKKKGMNTRRKTWQADYAPSSDEDEEIGEGEQINKKENEENKEKTETEEAKIVDPKNIGEGTQSDSGNLMDVSSHGEGTQTTLVIHEEAPISGFKRGHESEKSDSDKEHPSNQKPEMVNGRQVVIATTSQGRWVEVKNKRKGKKGKIEAYYQP